ncbi:hypothetical protein ABTJ77_19140, partial [Acinetobacter baumannii]
MASQPPAGFCGKNGAAQAAPEPATMAVTPRNGLGALPVRGCIIALVLLSFTAIRLMGSSLEARSYALSQATVGTAAAT